MNKKKICMYACKQCKKKNKKKDLEPSHIHILSRAKSWLAVVRSTMYPRPCATFAGAQAELCKRILFTLWKNKKGGGSFFQLGQVGERGISFSILSIQALPAFWVQLDMRECVYCTFAFFERLTAS